MKFEILKDNKKILLVAVIVFVVILTLIIRTSLAKYKVTESINIASGTINYNPSDFSLIGIYLEGDNGYTQNDTIPESGYTLNSEESYCKVGDSNVDVTISYDFTNKSLSISPMTLKGLKCYLYFDEIKGQTVEDIVATKTISTRTDFSTSLTADTTGTIYSAEDDDGTSYYYAGAVTDNWVIFAGFYWRIIRFNGDGSIRLIYNGTTTSTTGTGTALEAIEFNPSEADNMYAGYMYTSGEVHGLGTSSTVKGVLDSWYAAHLSSYSNYIDTDAGFCGDRTPYLDRNGTTSGGGTGTTGTYYGATIRLDTNKSPILTCPDARDLYTISSSSKGNKALTYPVGMITADEVAFAGVVFQVTNESYYLYTGEYYLTMSPHNYLQAYRAVRYFMVYAYGLTMSSGGGGIRPVINLKAGTLFETGGTGTSTNPYEVE